GEDVQVGPRELAAVLPLDRPQETACLVEIGVVRPTVERREALLATAGAAAAIGDAIGAGAVPRHANEEAAIVAEIGRPPILRIRHQGVQVLEYGIEVETFEFLGVVELSAHRIASGRMLIEDLKVELVRPPVAVGVRTASAAVERALALTH